MSIKLTSPAFISIDAETQTAKRITCVYPNYFTSVKPKQVLVTPSEPILDEEQNQIGETEAVYQTVNQGYVTPFLNDNENNRVFTDNDVEVETFGNKNILVELHTMYLAKLKALNPSVSFELSSEFK
jgi:hypothetical protein